jgi:hypothetical protein
MSLVGKASTPPIARRGGTCLVGLFLQQLEPDEADGLRELMANPRWTSKMIVDEVRKSYPDAPPRESVERHRRGDASNACLCVQRGMA